MQVSERVCSIPEALSIHVNELVYEQKRRGVDVTVLSLGEAFFDIPQFDFSRLDFVKGYHYSDSRGIPELRAKICRFYSEHYSASVDPSREIIVSAGSKPIIFFSMQSTLNPGDKVLIHEPGWLSYQEQARLVGAIPEFIPYDCDSSCFSRYFDSKTRMVVINNPNNPAGKIYSSAELLAIYNQCRSNGIWLLVDEAYSDFVVNDEFHSMAKLVPDKDGVIVVNSLSKNMGMSGWRVGYVISDANLSYQLQKINQHVITCAPTILQYYMAEYFDEVISITLPQVRMMVEKRARISQLMSDIELTHLQGGATFYFMVSIGDFPGTSLDFCLELLFNHQIAVVPGSAYGQSTSRFVRVGIGTESEERIHDALLVMKDLTNARTLSAALVKQRLEESGLHHLEPLMQK
ncbi:MAG: pyridoxal phosphate-dependent aminotransferase [Candidatus Melainabacteria bacterium]|nr:pyridoxal phosphate-dependent aminotransferase [Candidatus Melainabacteria bacterium]